MNYHNTRHRIATHESNLKIVPVGHKSRATETRTIVSESWRSGGGVIPHGADRATCVRHIIDPDYVFFGATSRHGALID